MYIVGGICDWRNIKMEMKDPREKKLIRVKNTHIRNLREVYTTLHNFTKEKPYETSNQFEELRTKSDTLLCNLTFLAIYRNTYLPEDTEHTPKSKSALLGEPFQVIVSTLNRINTQLLRLKLDPIAHLHLTSWNQGKQLSYFR